MKLYNVHILADDDIEASVARITRETQTAHWVAWEPPRTLMGNYKVLTLRAPFNSNIVCKVEGPSFVIDAVHSVYFDKKP